MERIVIADRTMGRILALLPGIVVAAAVRVLTLGRPVVWERAGAAAVVAVAAWVAYRLLTARVVVAEAGIEVRGVLYEGVIGWDQLESVEVRPAAMALRSLVWGVMQPHGLVLRGRTRTLRPIGAIGPADDEDLRRAMGAIRVRLGAWGIPAQREGHRAAESTWST